MGLQARVLAPVLLLGLLACGGAHPSNPGASTLAYTDPADATHWRFTRDSSSTGSHLVLDLMAPAGTSGMGVTLVLDVDGARAAWGTVAGAGLVGTGAYQGPLAQKASLQGAELRILVSQENPTPPLAYAGAPVLTVALDLGRGVPPGPVALTVSQAGHLAAPRTMPTATTVDLGTLTAQ